MKILKFSKELFIADQGRDVYENLSRGWVDACDGRIACYNAVWDCFDVTGADGIMYSVEHRWCEEAEAFDVREVE